MPLGINNGLTPIYMRFGTSDKNEAIFFSRVNYCAGMNVETLKLHQYIITTNKYIVESYIQFDYENHFDLIFLN